MQRWIDLWNSYWFPRTTTRALGISRIVVIAAQMFLLFPAIESNIQLAKRNPDFMSPQLLIAAIGAIVPDGSFFTPTGFSVIRSVTIVAGVTCLIGLFTRTSAFLFALGNWILIAHAYSYADIHHTEAIWCIFLMLLAFTPSGNSFSLDALIKRRLRNDHAASDEKIETAVWPLKLVHVLLGLTYFSTGLAKMVYGGVDWLNGYTLQTIMLTDAVGRNLPLGIWLAQNYTLCLLLSFYTIWFELFFVVSVFVSRTIPFFLINAILFQVGLYLFAGHDFFQHMILLTLLLVFFQSQWCERRLVHRRWAVKVAEPQAR
jgi:uncharacterized membrane protein YphA (DoxX/SURF4 family)